jgi:hypothetical protein
MEQSAESDFWTPRREEAAEALFDAGYWHDNMPPGTEKTLEAFLVFHDDNPGVLRDLIDMAREWKAAGRQRGEMRLFLAQIRYQRTRQLENPNGEFKINNNHGAWYARLVMATCSDLAGFFELRPQGSRDGD